MPSGGRRRYFCDDCVPRGCSCNVENIEGCDAERLNEITNNNDIHVLWWSKSAYENAKHSYAIRDSATRWQEDSFYFEVVDNDYRRNPCCEYDYCADGYEIEENIYGVLKQDIQDVYKRASKWIDNFPGLSSKGFVAFFRCKRDITEYVNTLPDDKLIPYNEVLAKVSYITYKHGGAIKMWERQWRCRIYKFFLSFRTQLIRYKKPIWQE